MATSNLNEPTSASNGNIPYIGATANDNTGNTIRESFNRINERLKEIFGSQNSSNVVQTPFIDGDNIKDDTIDSQHYAAGSIDTEHIADNQITNAKMADDAIDSAEIADGAVDLVHLSADSVDGTKIVDDAIDSEHYTDGSIDLAHLAADSVDGSKIVDDAIDSEHYTDGSIDTVHIADDQITHAKLENRYTTTATAVTTSGATTIDWSTAASFPITMGGAHTLNFSNFKKGQVVDLIISGAYAVTLGTTSGTPVFNKVGTQSYDTTTTNIIQVMCTDDDSTPNFFFAIGTYAVAQPQ